MFVRKSSDYKEGVRPVVKVASPQLVDALKEVLSDTVVLYFKALGYHWNVKGADFSQYHSLFEEIYEDLGGAIDPTAENILVLGANAPYSLMDYHMMSSVKDSVVGNDPMSMARDLLLGHEQILMCLNRALGVATMADEQGLINFLAGRIEKTQKWIWQLKSSSVSQ